MSTSSTLLFQRLQSLQLTRTKPDTLHPWEQHYVDEVGEEDAESGRIEFMQDKGFYPYFLNGLHSDLTVRDANGREWKVHKLIVTKGCDFFVRALKGGFKESRTNVIEMPNDPPSAVKAMLDLLYSEDYAVITPTRNIRTLKFHLDVWITAVIYDMAGLQEMAYRRFVRLWMSGGCPRFILPLLAERIYDCTMESDEWMRVFVANMSAVHLPGLLLQDDFRQVMADSSEFSADVARALARLQDHAPFPCRDCKNHALESE
ncbi:uncharacterized protein J3D65DRAFT_677173 [Phyllosticta citribraziliensis]|uniref:BTB domain-containing protein n=1 Tax=Phyllosticta citribraziliensis TaxID=989973 RepID=A0ABR1LPQ9_9PEZI